MFLHFGGCHDGLDVKYAFGKSIRPLFRDAFGGRAPPINHNETCSKKFRKVNLFVAVRVVFCDAVSMPVQAMPWDESFFWGGLAIAGSRRAVRTTRTDNTLAGLRYFAHASRAQYAQGTFYQGCFVFRPRSSRSLRSILYFLDRFLKNRV